MGGISCDWENRQSVDVLAPHHVIQSPVDMDVLAVLAGADTDLTGRQVTDRARGGHSGTVYRSLERLTRLGLLQARSAGRASLYRLNRRHLAADAVMALVSLRSAMLDELREAVAMLDPPPVSAALFGPAARGEGGPETAIDIVILQDAEEDPAWSRDWDAQIDALRATMQRRLGNPIRIHRLSVAEAVHLAETRSEIAVEILAGQIPLHGRSIDEVLGAGSA